MSNVTFARNLVKGKIAETIFAQMLRDTQKFTVIEFGYEKVIPELIEEGYNEDFGIIETIKSAPDFVVIDRESRKVHLIEVKYLRQLNQDYILQYAQRMAQSWNPSYIFVATMDGFFLGEIDGIIKGNGRIAPLPHSDIPYELQMKYLKILQDFEGRN